MEDNLSKVNQILAEVCKVVSGKDAVVRLVMMAMLAKGHILIEDIPGVGKTTLALAFSKVMQLEYHRMQFTPDVMPTDVVGFNMYTKDGGELGFREGSIMCNLFLADEINRTSPKTQSALLEVMEEGCVTVDSVTRPVPKPFHVIATQNPIGSAGTQALPESQLDRFMVRLSMGYPDIRSEVDIMRERHMRDPLEQIHAVITRNELIGIQQQVEQVFIHDAIYNYIAKLVDMTRHNELISLGVSPRGSLAIANMAKASAFMSARSYCIPEDVVRVFKPVTTHRMLLSARARVNHVTLDKLSSDIIAQVIAPRLISDVK